MARTLTNILKGYNGTHDAIAICVPLLKKAWGVWDTLLEAQPEEIYDAFLRLSKLQPDKKYFATNELLPKNPCNSQPRCWASFSGFPHNESSNINCYQPDMTRLLDYLL